MLLKYGAREDPDSPLDSKEIKPVNTKGNQPFIGRTDAEAESPILWPPTRRDNSLEKNPDAGKDWRQGGEEGNREYDGWMVSLIQWTWT